MMFEKLASRDLLSFARREKIHDLLLKWSRMLGQIDAVLADAEEKQMKTSQRGIKLWLEDLEDLAYDLDDVLDEFSTEALRQHVLNESRASTSQKPKGQKQMEDLGREYFRELLSRSFFQPSSSGGHEVSLFVMHDLINDLAQFVAGRICLRLGENPENNEDHKNITKARHSSYIRGHLDGIKSGSVESNVLDMLRPHINLKELTIIGYHGLTFPTWVGNSLFCNMVSLKFQNCENCISLPHLGQLPSLENLHIQGMKAIENIGLEFYGLGCSNPFPALQILTLENMPEWQDWSHFGVEERAQAFIRLSELSIKRCPKLLGKLPKNLPRLKKLEIKECPLLVFAWAPSPTELNQVRNTLHFEALMSLSLTHVLIPDSWNPEVGNEAMLENARYSHLSSLISLTIKNIQGLRCLPGWFLQGLTGLQELFIRGCQELTSLWKNEVRQRHQLPALRRLKIENCPQLISFCKEDENKDNEEGLQQHEELPYLMMLEHLEMTYCEKLERLPQELHNLKYLQDLIIFQCPCLISFPKEGLPSTLTTLRITNCDALQSLPELTMLSSLEILEVSVCPSLTYLSCSKTGLPPTLKSLVLDYCGNLESILAEEGMKINCPSLESVLIGSCESLKSLPDLMQNNYNSGCLRNLSQLCIHDCDNVESIPEGWFTATNLRELRMYRCKKLKGPPYRVYNNLTSLQKLYGDNCISATGLVFCILNNAQFTNLTELRIVNVDMGNKPRSEWGLHRLSSLTTLLLGRYGGASFPPEEKDGMMQWLPPSLTTLHISAFPNLEKLYCKDFQNLPSLGELEIWKCPKLTTITELGQLPSLSKLLIDHCPNVESFSAEDQAFRLPPSILRLYIYGCSKLKERCEKKKGQYWPLISHIPHVEIDGRLQDTTPQIEATNAKPPVQNKYLNNNDYAGDKQEGALRYDSAEGTSAGRCRMEPWPDLSLSHASKTHQDSMGTEVSKDVTEITEIDSSRCDATSQLDGSSSIFQNQLDDGEQSDFVDYGWSNIGSFDDLDRIFRFPGTFTKPLTMTPQEKIEKLRRRQQMQALLAIQRQQQQFSNKVSSSDHSVSLKCHDDQIQLMPGGNIEVEETVSTLLSVDPNSPAVHDGLNTIPMVVDDCYSVEAITLHQLREIVAKLDIRMRNFMRDSLFRLAQSAMHRNYAGDTSSINKNSGDELEVCTDETSSHTSFTRIPDLETQTNHIDRAVAHLLFHRPELSGKHSQTPESPSLTKLPCEINTGGLLSSPREFLSDNSRRKRKPHFIVENAANEASDAGNKEIGAPNQ
ncbi:hypothetical protein RHGRI_019679 [Rhododendron griersonianum]|uniref:Rx N-terminal domain-containing protein n=1 Tax=Rhododendron griersonianum TaxID=479676 RepID=A0AAV6JEK2_9ERIC|nr:hypothetical protein RHGRI_019679 [Rhododendron griersonianum]